MFISNAILKLLHGYMRLDGDLKDKNLSLTFQLALLLAISLLFYRKFKEEIEEDTVVQLQTMKGKERAIMYISGYSVSRFKTCYAENIFKLKKLKKLDFWQKELIFIIYSALTDFL